MRARFSRFGWVCFCVFVLVFWSLVSRWLWLSIFDGFSLLALLSHWLCNFKTKFVDGYLLFDILDRSLNCYHDTTNICFSRRINFWIKWFWYYLAMPSDRFSHCGFLVTLQCKFCGQLIHYALYWLYHYHWVPFTDAELNSYVWWGSAWNSRYDH